MSTIISDNKGLSARAIQNLKNTAGSLRLFTISFLFILGVMSIALLMGTYLFLNNPELKPYLIFFLIGYAYVGFSVYIQLQLLKASAGFKSFVEQKRSEGLEEAYGSLKVYWKLSGYLTIGTIAASILTVLVFVFFFREVIERIF